MFGLDNVKHLHLGTRGWLYHKSHSDKGLRNSIDINSPPTYDIPWRHIKLLNVNSSNWYMLIDTLTV